MIVRSAKPADFTHLETFVWQAIFPTFDVEGLTEEQRGENDALVEGARGQLNDALQREGTVVLAALAPRSQSLLGYVIADGRRDGYAEIVLLLVKRSHWGKGVAAALLEAARGGIGRHRPLSAAIRNYNDRAKAFFAKHGFEDTGETVGDFAIPRVLYQKAADCPVEEPLDEGDDPEAADPQSPQPVYEPLPDLNLSNDGEEFLPPTGGNALSLDADAGPLFQQTTLDDKLASQVDAFIAKAKASKAAPQPKREVPAPPEVETTRRKPTILAVSFPDEVVDASPPPTKSTRPQIDFEVEDLRTPPPAVSTTRCASCGTELPRKARFCHNCGTPQAAEVAEPPPPATEVLELAELPTEQPEPSEPLVEKIVEEIESSQVAEDETISLSDLKNRFIDNLLATVPRYFGESATANYRARLAQDDEFQRVRDASLSSLHRWLATAAGRGMREGRIEDTLADLTEYFLVESAGDLHGGTFPQRLLRHQSVPADTLNVFQVVTDYLNFNEETDVVYTDFITMPGRALRNATQTFLFAAKRERILFICDQSLIGQAKNGFAMTDEGMYWKNIFQPPGRVSYRQLQPPKMENGHLLLNGQYFDAGGRLNLKMVLLLDRLRRLRGPDVAPTD